MAIMVLTSTDHPDAEPDGMLAYGAAMANPSRDDPTWPLPSFDARDWAKQFMATAERIGRDKIDEELMVTWFANALMRGYDEAARRTPRWRGPSRRSD